MKEILITGSGGFLSKNLVPELTKLSYNLVDLNSIGGKRIDISKTFSIKEQRKFEAIIHTAGKAHVVPRTLEEELEFKNVNYQGTINLCNAIDKLNIKPNAFVFISSIAVYGLISAQKIDEYHTLNGITPFAKSKILAENYLVEWAANNNITLSILRLPLVAGLNPPGNLGAMIDSIKKGKYFSIGNANARKSVVWAADIATIIPKLIEIGGVYNLTDGYNPTIKELEISISTSLGKTKPKKIPILMAQLIAKIGDFIGSKAPINTKKLNTITSTLTLDDSKAQKMLNWKPTLVIDKIPEIV